MGDSVTNIVGAVQGNLNLDSITGALKGGANLEGIWAIAKDKLQLDAIWAKIIGLKDMVPPEIVELYNTHTVIFMLAAACILILLAFEGYKLFKTFMYAISGIFFGVAGYWYLAPKIHDKVASMVPEGMEVDALIAVCCALVAVFICKFAYTVMVAILGGAAGYALGSMYVFNVLVTTFSSLDSWLNNDKFKIICGVVFAAILLPLFILLFKHLFIIGSSILCSLGASTLIQKILVPDASDDLKISFMILGAVLAIVTIILQYKNEKKSYEFIF